MKKALITGVNGQDGSYLCELLLSKGYEVHGTKRRSSTVTTGRIAHLLDSTQGVDVGGRIILHHADVTDSSSINRVIDSIEPDEIYNLAAQSHVAVSFDEPEYTANSDALGVLRCLEAIRRRDSGIRFYQASTSELYGGQETAKYNELSPLNPRSPYAAAKAYAYYIVKQYREAYGIYAVNGILFNHESPRRGENFVTKKITLGISRILEGSQKKILLGNLSAKRDWGHARDYVEAMWKMLQCETPADYVIATGKAFSIREFLSLAFSIVGIEISFEGTGIHERGVVSGIDPDLLSKYTNRRIEIGAELVAVHESYFRPLEVDHLVGDSTKARVELNWIPKTPFAELVEEMVISDIHSLRKP